MEGGCVDLETFHCLILTKEKRWFTEPPAAALFDYISCGLLWRIFCQTGIFSGVFSICILFTGRISEAAMGGGGGRRKDYSF